MIENLKINKKTKIAIIGMGYVGLPLAIKLAKKISIIGYDIDKKKFKILKIISILPMKLILKR